MRPIKLSSILGITFFAMHFIASAQLPSAPGGTAAAAGVSVQAPAQPPLVSTPVPAEVLAWSADSQEYQAKPGELVAHFMFFVTNVSARNVIIHHLTRACGCTEATLPETPWTMWPGTNGAIKAAIDLRGKSGRISKPLTANSSEGSKVLWLNVSIPANANSGAFNMDRTRNLELAKANRQVIFGGDCAKCHVEPTIGKTGRELYVAACGICHDAAHRAAMVPDLRANRRQGTDEYWREWITTSKPGSLMPAFAQSEGGPLNPEQVNSLVAYLVTAMPSEPVPQ